MPSPKPKPRSRRSIARERLRRRRKRQFIYQILWGLVWAVVLVGVLTAVWYVTRMEEFTISNVSVQISHTVSKESIEEVVEEELSGKYYEFIPRRFTYLYPHGDIVEAVEGLPRIQSATVLKPKPDTIQIKFEEYKPIGLWCSLTITDRCFFLDELGYTFAEAPNLKGGSLNRYYKQDQDPEIGDHPFTTTYLEETDKFREIILKEFGFAVSQIVADQEDTTYRLTNGGELRTSQEIPLFDSCLLYTSPSPRDRTRSRMPSSA